MKLINKYYKTSIKAPVNIPIKKNIYYISIEEKFKRQLPGCVIDFTSDYTKGIYGRHMVDVKIFDPNTSKILCVFCHNLDFRKIYYIKFSPDGSKFIVGGSDQGYIVNSISPPFTFTSFFVSKVKTVAWSPSKPL